MPILSPTGAPLVDIENDSPREDLPAMLDDLVTWAEARSVPFFANEAAMKAALTGLGPSDRRLAITSNNNALWMHIGNGQWTILTQAGGGAWTNFNAQLWGINSTECVRLGPGNGTLHTARYKMLDPKTMVYNYRFDRGSSTQNGASNLLLGVSSPLQWRHGYQPGAATFIRNAKYQIANTQGYRMSGDDTYNHYVIWFPSTTFAGGVPADGWTGADLISFTVTVEVV